jgi:hypothetical protein
MPFAVLSHPAHHLPQGPPGNRADDGIDPEADLDRVREIIAAHCESEGTRSTYFNGLAKLKE